MRSYCIHILVLLIGHVIDISAQPNWVVNPSVYEFTMTVTGIAVVECQESMDENDIIAAFINDEVRGVQPLNTEIDGRRYAYLIIYENQYDGQEITFKMYDASRDSIYETKQVVVFEENGIVGTEDDPFIFSDHQYVITTFLSQDSIESSTPPGALVANLFSVNDLQDTVSMEYELLQDEWGADYQYFTIVGSTLLIHEEVNSLVKSSYQIHIATHSPIACSRDDVFVLHVSGSGTTAIQESENHPDEQILFSPNPASDWIRFADPLEITQAFIYAMDGKSVQSVERGAKTIDISNLSPGMYPVQIFINGEKTMRMLVVN